MKATESDHILVKRQLLRLRIGMQRLRLARDMEALRHAAEPAVMARNVLLHRLAGPSRWLWAASLAWRAWRALAGTRQDR